MASKIQTLRVSAGQHSFEINEQSTSVEHHNVVELFQDYLTRKELGIRIKDEVCRVIRMRDGQWVEIGQEYKLPVDSSILAWGLSGIPASTLAVALRIYELDHPGADLRLILTRKPSRPHPRSGHGRQAGPHRAPKNKPVHLLPLFSQKAKQSD